MFRTKLTDNFHSMRLVLTDSTGTSLTVSVGASVRVTAKLGASVTGDVRGITQTLRSCANAIMAYLTDRKSTATYGERMRAIEGFAKTRSFGGLTTMLGGK